MCIRDSIYSVDLDHSTIVAIVHIADALFEEIGDLCGRFSYEFACDISPRVPRVYIKNGKEI